MRSIAILFSVILYTVALCGQAIAADESNTNKSKPVVLLFETTKSDDIDKSLATSTTRAVRNYLRESQRVEVTIFDRESPTVQRAVLDKKLTPDEVASYSKREDRITVGNILGFQYVGGADISTELPKDAKGVELPENKMLKIRVWLVDVTGNAKTPPFEAVGSAIIPNASATDLENAMQSATSKAVLDITRMAFDKLPRIDTPAPGSPDESTAIGGASVPQATQPTSGDYSSQAEESLNAGNLAVAIQEYSRAISADPNNGPLRIKLAETYAKKGLFTDAYSALDGALQVGADKALVDAAREKITKMENGQSAAPVESPKEDVPKTTPKPADPAVTQQQKPDKTVAAQAVAKMVEGDKLWRKGEPDEAAKAYVESIRLNPSDWRAYERLALVDASMSMFSESRKVLEQLKTVQPKPSAEITANRYKMLRKAFDKAFLMLLSQYESESTNFDASKTTRESFYSTINGLTLRSDSMVKFLDALNVPDIKQTANLRRSLACGLFAQAASSMLDYLETNSEQSKDNAKTFINQAKKELETASQLDENKVVITREPQPKPEPEPEPTDQQDNQPADPSQGDLPQGPVY